MILFVISLAVLVTVLEMLKEMRKKYLWQKALNVLYSYGLYSYGKGDEEEVLVAEGAQSPICSYGLYGDGILLQLYADKVLLDFNADKHGVLKIVRNLRRLKLDAETIDAKLSKMDGSEGGGREEDGLNDGATMREKMSEKGFCSKLGPRGRLRVQASRLLPHPA